MLQRRLLPAGLLVVSLVALAAPPLGCAYFRDDKTKLEEAAAAMDAGDEARAEKLYREMLQSKGSASDEARALLINLLINRGGRLMDAGKPGDAMPLYREAMMLDRSRDNSRIAYARALMKDERFTEAIDVLMEAKGCRGCKTMVSVIFIERGKAALRDGEYADALEDFDLALTESRDSLTVLMKVDVYTEGHYGSADDAVTYLDQALAYMPIDQTGTQQLWWDKRNKVIYQAALQGEHAAIDAALALEDPRREVAPEQKIVDKLNLRMYAASLQIYAKYYDEGIARGLQTYADAKGAVPDEAANGLRETLMGLYMQRASMHLAADEDGKARGVIKEALKLDPENRILGLQLVIAEAERNSGTARKLLDASWQGDAEYDRIRALVEAAYVRKMIGIGQFVAAAKGVERAAKYAPDLLETHLAAAELAAETRMPELRKVWVETFREIDKFDYPKARINNYGRALAELRDVQSKYDDAAARDFLRGPAVAARIEALESRLAAFYPYDAALAPADQADKAIVVLRRAGDGEETEASEIEVKVQGPRAEHVVKVPAGGEAELVLKSPGLAIVRSGSPKPLFAEPGIKIIVEV